MVVISKGMLHLKDMCIKVLFHICTYLLFSYWIKCCKGHVFHILFFPFSVDSDSSSTETDVEEEEKEETVEKRGKESGKFSYVFFS